MTKTIMDILLADPGGSVAKSKALPIERRLLKGGKLQPLDHVGMTKSRAERIVERFISDLRIVKEVMVIDTWEDFDQQFANAQANKILAAFEWMISQALEFEVSENDLMEILDGFNKRIKKVIRSKDKLTSLEAKQIALMPSVVFKRHKIDSQVINRLIK